MCGFVEKYHICGLNVGVYYYMWVSIIPGYLPYSTWETLMRELDLKW